ncbi:Calmodulin-binding transcription activator 1 [Dissostichus eleginoides]|uniref:Calmodulin-binding transcription activator 1 n=1 Tax=Dissostichus eleginoides TaxID=100907 RepID=A0AAD9CCF2_DISEL|nr:Calmodulin-binding transcription activator 1 [Dissostichus eleginoides]
MYPSLPFLCGNENPDIVLVHYLNVPAIEDCGKPCGPILCSINTDKKEWAKWTKEELIGQLKPMLTGQSSALPLDLWHHSDRAESVLPLLPRKEVEAEEGSKLVIDSC